MKKLSIYSLAILLFAVLFFTACENTFEGPDDPVVDTLKGSEINGHLRFFIHMGDHGLTITDAESEGNPDGGKAMQIFWNSHPKEGITLIKPYNLDRTNEGRMAEAMDGMKMFVGKKGDFVDVYGNSNHPNAKFLTEKVGYNWAFVASGSETGDAAVAEVGLPLSTLDAEGRSVLLKEYSIHNVLYNEVKTVWPNASERILEGEAPAPEFLPLVRRIIGLAPYNPKSIANQEINFN